MPILSKNDLNDMYNEFVASSYTNFVISCTNIFVNRMVPNIPKDFKERMMDCIRHARRRRDLAIMFPITFEIDDAITFRGRSIAILDIVMNTDALQQLAAEIGEDIRIRPHVDGETIWLQVEYWPRPPHPEPEPEEPIHNPELFYADMPDLESSA